MPLSVEVQSDLKSWLLHKAIELNSGCEGTPDLVNIAKLFDAKVNFLDVQKRAGLLALEENGKAVISVGGGRKGNGRAQRFTLAHEIGHLLLLREKGYRPAEFRDNASYYQMEKLCNYFAGKLLVPRTATEKLVIENPKDAANAVFRISSHCAVSKVVAANEIVDNFDGLGFLNLIPTTVEKRGGRPRFEVQWSCGVPDSMLGYSTGRKLTVDDALIKGINSRPLLIQGDFDFRLGDVAVCCGDGVLTFVKIR